MRNEVQCKIFWLDLAEIIDSLRIFPRLLISWYGYWIAHVVYYTLHWYFNMPSAERSTQVTAVIGIIIPGVLGLGTYLYKLYSDAGRTWGQPEKRDQNATS